jgi:hypothetical protein
VDFAEEEVDEYGECPKDQIIHPPNEGWDVLAFFSHCTVEARWAVSGGKKGGGVKVL